MQVAAALSFARARGLDRLDAQLLLAHHLGRPRSWLIAHDDEPLPPPVALAFRNDVARRAAGVPLAYLLGRREFHGIELQVTPAVLVPRPETEGLVDWALECVADRVAPRIADLGTGSGAIAIAIARQRRDARIDAVDVDPEALAVARGNAAAAGVELQFAAGDWWQPLGAQCFDLVVSNPPYIAEHDPHLAALCHEPRQALVSGADGLDALRAISAGAAARLQPGAWLLVEHGFNQAARVRELMTRCGLVDACTRTDLAGIERCTGARRPR